MFAPPFPCQHGLSYTNFTFADLTVSGTVSATTNATVSFTVTNSRDGVLGAEVPQLYVAGPPGDPVRALKAFGYTGELKPGAATAVVFTLTAQDLAVWSTAAHALVLVPPASYTLWVGSSSRDLRLTGTVVVQ